MITKQGDRDEYLNAMMRGGCLLIIAAMIGLPMTAEKTFSQSIEATLFGKADSVKLAITETGANVLAPKNYGEAIDYYNDAREDFDKGRNLEDIRKKLRAAVNYFKQAEKSAKLARLTLTNAIKARDDALNADAPHYATELWDDADEEFADAARELEKGDVKDAEKRGAKAETLFRQAELKAIKANYLDETRKLIETAKDIKAEKKAPITLAKAVSLIEQTEKELEQNRYDTDYPRSLARQAKYEAKHAIYLTRTIKTLEAEDKEFEHLLLAAEQPLIRIAGAIDLVPEFDNGYDQPTSRILEYIKAMQDRNTALAQDLADRNQQISDLSSRIAELEEKLGGVEKEKSELALRIEAQARVKKQYNDVEKTFTKEEAQVLRTPENELVLRLLGLNFASGKSEIEPKYFSLLSKVQNAIKTFEGCTVKVEGHTDSFGGDDLNQKLSQERAEAVKAYLMANMGLDDSRIEAVGYGENRPIANNETREGREKNRRIDIIIQPKL
ncbi:MAG: OmpA family protein [candidate division KSB1 bacterium]|nr:OmpA family protein [candidate division KSB1 bacterium]